MPKNCLNLAHLAVEEWCGGKCSQDYFKIPHLRQLRSAELLDLGGDIRLLQDVPYQLWRPSDEEHVDRGDLAVLDPPEIRPHLRFREHIFKQVAAPRRKTKPQAPTR